MGVEEDQVDLDLCLPDKSMEQHLHPQKLTWNLKIEVWKMTFLFNWAIFGFHASFGWCDGL